ncbi:MAG: hypothetical protein ACPGO7_04120 [Alphaproteobacteria bacterium]
MLEKLRLPSKVFTFSATITEDGAVTLNGSGGESDTWVDLANIDWERVIVDLDVTAVSGTSPTLDLKLKTANSKEGTAVATGTLNAVDGNAAAMAMTQATAATREIKGFGRRNSDADAAGVSNIGKFFGLYADVSGTSPSFTVNGTVYFGK